MTAALGTPYGISFSDAVDQSAVRGTAIIAPGFNTPLGTDDQNLIRLNAMRTQVVPAQ
jgi:hypothetical protein